MLHYLTFSLVLKIYVLKLGHPVTPHWRRLTSHGIGSGRQHKNKWDGGIGVHVALIQVKGRRLDKLLPQFAIHKFSYRRFHFVWPETTKNDHLLQLIELFAPRTGQRTVAWIFALENCLKVF